VGLQDTPGGEVLDYGCSGILSIAALHMGAARCVDVEAEGWWHPWNVHLNGYSEFYCTREVVPYALCTPVASTCASPTF
jgi:hypothetical protein